MLRTSVQATLVALRDRLVALERSLPASADKVQARRRELLHEVTAMLKSWRPRWPSGGPANLEAAVAELETVAENLEETTALAQGLCQEVGELKGRAQRLDAAVVQWIEIRGRDWLEQLAAVGADVTSSADVAVERRRLVAVESTLRQHFLAVFRLGELHKGLATFQEGAPSSAEELVRELVRTLIETGVTLAWLRRAEAGCQRLGEQQLEETRRPPELGVVARLLPLLRGWSRVLDRDQAEVQDLESRFRGVVVADWTTLPPQLERDAKQLEAGLRRHAEASRRDGLHDLKRIMGELVGLCGPQPAVEQEVTALEGRKVTRSQHHQRWMGERDRALERLGAIASSHHSALEALLGQRCAELDEALLALRADPLSNTVSEGADEVAHGRVALAEPKDVEDLVVALSRAAALLEQVGRLCEQAQSDLASLRNRQHQLRQTSAVLHASAAALGLAAKDVGIDGLGPAIDALTVVDGKASLEHALDAADRLERQLAKGQQRFAARCRRTFDATAETFSVLAEIVSRLESNVETPSFPAWEGSLGPTELASTLRASTAARERLDQLAARIERTLPARRKRLAVRLEELATGMLDPSDRESVDHLLIALATPSDEATDPPDGLSEWGEWLLEGEALVERHEAARRSVADRRNALGRRLKSCRDEGLGAWHGHGWQRVIALVYGLPDPPSCSPDHLAQLDQAELLCARLEQVSRKIEVSELALGVAALRLRAKDPASRALLAQIEALDQTAFPTMALRKRVREALGHGTRRSAS